MGIPTIDIMSLTESTEPAQGHVTVGVFVECHHSGERISDVCKGLLNRVIFCDELGQRGAGHGVPAFWLGSEHHRNFIDVRHGYHSSGTFLAS
jgi:hypothetical protein